MPYTQTRKNAQPCENCGKTPDSRRIRCPFCRRLNCRLCRAGTGANDHGGPGVCIHDREGCSRLMKERLGVSSRKEVPPFKKDPEPDLNPCPFCGHALSETILEDSSLRHVLYTQQQCLSCGARGPRCQGAKSLEQDTRDKAIKGWNDRVT